MVYIIKEILALQLPLGNETDQMVLLAESHSPSQFERNTVLKKNIWYTKKEIQFRKKRNMVYIIKEILALQLPLGNETARPDVSLIAESHSHCYLGSNCPVQRGFSPIIVFKVVTSHLFWDQNFLLERGFLPIIVFKVVIAHLSW